MSYNETVDAVNGMLCDGHSLTEIVQALEKQGGANEVVLNKVRTYDNMYT